MFRRCNADKMRMEPELNILLRNIARYPADTLQGVAVVGIASPVDLLTLEVRLSGEERSTLGGLLITEKNPEARKTIYYEQFITLRGVDHDSLEQQRGLLGRLRVVVSQDVLRRSGSNMAPQTITDNNGSGDLSPDVPSAENSSTDWTPSIINATAVSGAAVHLVPGTYSFPFKVTLPDSLPPSRELRRAHEGASVLRYRAVATMILCGGKVFTAETPFKVNPLPVQVQRWYQLHGDEQGVTDTSEAEDADTGSPMVEGGAARTGLKVRLMSSPGTINADAADRENEITSQRRIRHYRKFPEQQLLAERAEYEKRAEANDKKKGDKDDGPASRQTAQEMTVNEQKSSRRPPPKTYRERLARQDEADNRSVDGNGDNGMEETYRDDDDVVDEVHAFEVDNGDGDVTQLPQEGEQLSSKAAGRSLAAHASTDAANTSKKKRRHHHHSKISDAAKSDPNSAMVPSNVNQLAFTPPEENLAPVPTHMATRHSMDVSATTPEDATAAAAASGSTKKSSRHKSHGKKDSSSSGDEVEERGAQAHRRRPRYVPPPWRQEFNINLRGGFLRSGKVRVKVSLRSPLVPVGHGKVMVKLLVDNSEGSGTITKVKYSLITRCYIRTKTEVYNYHVVSVESMREVNIEKEHVVAIPEMEVLVPKSMPLTLLTEGMGTRTFLNIRFYVCTALKTFSKSVETEVVLVSGQDSQNNSRRLLRWTCFYRRRNNEDVHNLTVRPPTVNLSDQNAKTRVMQGSAFDHLPSSLLNKTDSIDADTSSTAPSAMSRSLMIMRRGKRVSKDAPSLDARRLASALNYDEAIFVPPSDEDDLLGPNSHVDPMSMLNPFAMPSNIGSTLPSAEREDSERR